MPQDTTAQNIPIWLLLRTIAPYRHPLRTAGRRALIWTIYHVVNVLAIMGIHGTIASVPWILMQTIVSPERSLMPR